MRSSSSGRRSGSVGPLRYCGVFAECIDPREFAGDADAVKRITQRYTAELERLVAAASGAVFLAASPLEASADRAEIQEVGRRLMSTSPSGKPRTLKNE